jgi:hypothetical protein
MATKALPSGELVHFKHRDTMRTRAAHAHAAVRLGAIPVPVTTLPIDCTGGAKVSCPMDGNDQYGDCMVATAAHVDNILTFGRGDPGWSESTFPLSSLERQYLAASGGDNGLDEPTLLEKVWRPGIGGNVAATYDDSLNVDVNNVALARFCIDRFFHVCMMWSVPDEFLRRFKPAQLWADPMTPDPNNGHGTPLSDVDRDGNYRLWTWGAWVWVSPLFVASVDPACFVVFSRRQFNAAGYDAHGRHVRDVAAAWVSIGGSKDIAASVAGMFPGPAIPSVRTLTLAEAQKILANGWPK